MSILSDMKKNFGKHPIPDPLLKLMEFASKCEEFFASGFEFGRYDGKEGLRTYSEADEFLSNLIEFANADGSGSTYAFWLGATKDVDKAPIVVFGSEGGVHVVAKSTLELLELLTLDTEVMVSWDEVVFYKEEGAEPSKCHSKYLTWAEKNFKIKPIKSAEPIVSQAQATLGEKFKSWMKKYYDH